MTPSAPDSRAPRSIGDAARSLASRFGLVALAIFLWAISIPGVDPGKMSDLGLLSVMPPSGFLAVAVLTASFVAAVHRRDRGFVIAIHFAVLIVFLHASIALTYDAARYSWAWKHVGVVDFIQRTGMIDTDIALLDVYHNWPSFFGLSALFTELGGFESAASFAAWSSTVFNVLFVGALVVVYRSLSPDPRVVWSATWLFLTANWVGQDYFAPQAFAFFLYLVAIGVLLRWYSKRPPRLLKRWTDWFRLRVLGGSHVRRLVERQGTVTTVDSIEHGTGVAEGNAPSEGDGRTPGGPWEDDQTNILAAVIFIILLAIITSHPLTPLMLTAAVAGLAILGVSRSKVMAVVFGVLTVGWMLTGAAPFITRQFASTVEDTGSVAGNIGGTFIDLSAASTGQVLVAWAGRSLVALIVVLAIAGAVRWLRHGTLDLRPFVLLVVPVTLVVGGSYDGEAVFRVYLFSLPFATFLAAHLWYPARSEGRGRRTLMAVTALFLVVVAGFGFAYFGKDQQYYFAPDEVQAAEFVLTTAAEGSLIVEGSRNYPSQFVNYEQFVYVPISREPAATHARIAADPTGVLEGWLANPDYPEAYVIITNSQKAEIDATGAMPRGSLDDIEEALAGSPRFVAVFDTLNATVFRLADPAPSGATP